MGHLLPVVRDRHTAAFAQGAAPCAAAGCVRVPRLAPDAAVQRGGVLGGLQGSRVGRVERLLCDLWRWLREARAASPIAGLVRRACVPHTGGAQELQHTAMPSRLRGIRVVVWPVWRV